MLLTKTLTLIEVTVDNKLTTNKLQTPVVLQNRSNMTSL